MAKKTSRASKTKKNSRTSRAKVNKKVSPSKKVESKKVVEEKVAEPVVEEAVIEERQENPVLNWILVGAMILFVVSGIAFLAARDSGDQEVAVPTNSANISVQGELNEDAKLNVIDGNSKNLPAGSSQSSSRLQPNATSGVQGSNTDLNRAFNQPTSGYQGGGYTGNEKIN